MKFVCAVLCLIFVSPYLAWLDSSRADSPQPNVAYFSNVREVRVAQPGRQNFFVIDEEIWDHSRSDLGDLRILSEGSQVQYFLSEQTAGISSDEVETKLLNLGSVAGHTEFDIDAQGLADYDRIRLRLDAKDFVASAAVTGSNELGQKPSVKLPSSTLYDFATEHLGSNFVLTLPPSTFRYLHVTLPGTIVPKQVKGAAIFNLKEQPASWTKFGSCSAPQQKQRATTITCNVPAKIPIDRIQFQVAPQQVNFRRSISVENQNGAQESTGEISRVRLTRSGTLVTSENLAVHVMVSSGEFTLSLDNGDNPPLDILSVQPLSLERRIYFDPQGNSTLKLYYGDEKLSPPVYDYARFFHLESGSAEAQLETGARNPQYTGRADDRPWSEQHKGILFAAMILAVLVLGVLALRGLIGKSPKPEA